MTGAVGLGWVRFVRKPGLAISDGRREKIYKKKSARKVNSLLRYDNVPRDMSFELQPMTTLHGCTAYGDAELLLAFSNSLIQPLGLKEALSTSMKHSLSPTHGELAEVTEPCASERWLNFHVRPFVVSMRNIVA